MADNRQLLIQLILDHIEITEVTPLVKMVLVPGNP